MNGSPSSRRSLIITLLFLTFYVWMALTIIKPITDFDFWWHLATGRYMVQHRIIPHVDVFSLTCRGRPWMDSYWLYEIILYAIYAAAGLNGVLIANAVLIISIFCVVDRLLCQYQISWLGRLIGLSLIFFGSIARGDIWSIQSSLITLLFVSLLLYSLARWEQTGKYAPLWIWPVFFALWANMHRGFTVGLGIAGLTLLSTRRSLKEMPGRLAWLSACGLATLLNPYGVRLYQMIWNDWRQSPPNIMAWELPTWVHWEIFWVTIVLLWLVLAFRMLRKEGRASDLLVAGFLSWSSHYAVNAPSLMVFAIPYILSALFAWLSSSSWFSRLRRYEVPVLVSVFLTLFWAQAHAHAQGGVNTSTFPVQAADLIAKERLPGPFYNDYRFGGYWIWRFTGVHPVFIDGRYPTVDGYVQLLSEINQAKYHRPEDWEAFLDRHKIQGALMKYPELSPYPALFDHYFSRKQWALVYWDDTALLFLRRIPANHSTILTHEFKNVSPDATFNEFARRVHADSPEQKIQIKNELLRNLTLHPDSRLTRLLLSLCDHS